MTFKPENDGIDHINVYSLGKTNLGAKLSNFYKHTIVLTSDDIDAAIERKGHYPERTEFESIEGLWYWLQLYNPSKPDNRGYNTEVNELCHLSFAKAKRHGKTLRTRFLHRLPEDGHLDETEFRMIIMTAMTLRIITDPVTAIELAESTLPLDHYYVNKGVRKDAGHRWVIDFWEELRNEAKKSIRTFTSPE